MLIKLLITMLLGSISQVAAAEMVKPEDVISSITQEIINEIKSKPDLASGNLGSINQLVDKKVMPILDFEKMTSLAVGKEWRSATESQKSNLMKVFRQLLLLTYSGSIKFAEQAKVQILPPRGKQNGKNVVVKTRVSVPGRQAVPINYRMKMTEGGWKIYDLNVLGLWLVENYRVQFSQIVSSKGIDGLIKEIDDKNRKLMSKSNS
ncbi:MAG: ABC transporter substrate-binding protein [Burkholderiaceae bacterium]